MQRLIIYFHILSILSIIYPTRGLMFGGRINRNNKARPAVNSLDDATTRAASAPINHWFQQKLDHFNISNILTWNQVWKLRKVDKIFSAIFPSCRDILSMIPSLTTKQETVRCF